MEVTELTKMALKVKNGECEFSELILAWSYHVRLNGWVRRKTFREQDAQDLRQEIWLNIFERFDEFQHTLSNFETWAFNRARQITRSWIRFRIKEQSPIIKKGYNSSSLRASFITASSGFDVVAQNDGILDKIFFIEDIKIAIDLMDVAQRDKDVSKGIIELLDEGFDQRDIVKKLNVTVGRYSKRVEDVRSAVLLIGR